MSRTPSYVTDYSQIRSAPHSKSAASRRLNEFLVEVVQFAGRKGAGSWPTEVRCFERPARRACAGRVVVGRKRGHDELSWQCPDCGANGLIRHWYVDPALNGVNGQTDDDERTHKYEVMAEVATGEAADVAQQTSGWLFSIKKHLGLPFVTTVLGVEVRVEGVKQLPDGCLVAMCRRGAVTQAVPLLELPMPMPAPKGASWVDAYRCWCSS